MEGLRQGHQAQFYDTVDQRFLGDARFLEDVDRRTAPNRTLAIRSPRVPFGKLLIAVAQWHTLAPRALLAPGRQRAAVPARAMLVYLAREWGQVSAQALGQRLRRDPSMISRLTALYAAQRNPTAEAQLLQTLAHT